MISNSITKKRTFPCDDLKPINIWAYGVGHFMNDICASSWFFFLSYYLIEIINLDKQHASYVLSVGQITDALATPVVGILSDKINTKFGKRTPWYFWGSILVAISFFFIFFSLINENASESLKLFYYMVLASLFNLGWASVQVSHMALLPLLTLNKKKKDFMTRIRTGFNFIAQTLSLLLSFVFFKFIDNKILQYQALAGSSVFLGVVMTLVFMFFCRESVLAKNIESYCQKVKEYVKNRKSRVSRNDNTIKDKNKMIDEENAKMNANMNVNIDFINATSLNVVDKNDDGEEVEKEIKNNINMAIFIEERAYRESFLVTSEIEHSLMRTLSKM